ncbi:hypothetical protein EV211_13016 [Aminicella lysinilytica]|uniref:MqsR (Motility quorum-sensing regulator) toxin of toxin-antitoxin system n=1 Tax=Aminicella lysinilytica TaxID=433323 RepID=A0A4R6Q025_9FIRM|nr:hypothetical protein EV211_13016 [Aminicella lysinilytica]
MNGGCSLIQITLEDIRKYLEEVHNSIREGNYRIDTNNRRQRNRELYTKYVIDEKLSKDILLSLQPEDFSEVVNNEHIEYEYERLYIFGKKVLLIERFGEAEKDVLLYIKFNKMEDAFVIVISFHEEEYPLHYPFR